MAIAPLENTVSSWLEYSEHESIRKNIHSKDLHERLFPVFGMTGELGSIASVIRKRFRDGENYKKFKGDLTEELGDLLWYITIISLNQGIKDLRFPESRKRCSFERDYLSLVNTCTRIGVLVRNKRRTTKGEKEKLKALVQTSLDQIAVLGYGVGVSILDIANRNLRKSREFWFRGDFGPAPYFDRDFPEHEQIPRRLDISFLSSSSGRNVLLQVNSVNIGDKLSDNAYSDDGYRYHDVFHIANFAVLGWSPVLRRMLKRKRKSDPVSDEVEDGARAALVEELVVNKIYDYVRDHDFFAKVQHVDMTLLKSVTSLVRDFEVKSCSPSEWRMAIRCGCKAFRSLREMDSGVVSFDADSRSVQVFKSAPMSSEL